MPKMDADDCMNQQKSIENKSFYPTECPKCHQTDIVEDEEKGFLCMYCGYKFSQKDFDEYVQDKANDVENEKRLEMEAERTLQEEWDESWRFQDSRGRNVLR